MQAVPPFSVLDAFRAAIAIALFLFLPGWLFVTAWLAKKKKADGKETDFGWPETLAASVFASIVFLALLGIALAFTVGVSVYSAAACEIALIGGLWFWKQKK
jgi:uncharacterized membrane protein